MQLERLSGWADGAEAEAEEEDEEEDGLGGLDRAIALGAGRADAGARCGCGEVGGLTGAGWGRMEREVGGEATGCGRWWQLKGSRALVRRCVAASEGAELM